MKEQSLLIKNFINSETKLLKDSNYLFPFLIPSQFEIKNNLLSSLKICKNFDNFVSLLTRNLHWKNVQERTDMIYDFCNNMFFNSSLDNLFYMFKFLKETKYRIK